MKDLVILGIIIALIYIIFFKGCSASNENNTAETEHIDYSKYTYETMFEFKYEHSPKSKNRYCHIYIDGLEVGEIDDGEIKSKHLILDGGSHEIFVEAPQLFKKNASSLKNYFEVTDDANTFEFVIVDDSFWGLSVDCKKSSYNDKLTKTAKTQ